MADHGRRTKFSLVPIIFGTLKSTFYAMLFAMPLALCGAIYVSHFTTPGFKRAIKPIVEIMAAVPSVVIGFLILLWLAPLLGKWLVAVFASFLTIPAVFVIFMLLWQGLRRYDWAKRVEHGYEFLVLMPVILLGGAVGRAGWRTRWKHGSSAAISRSGSSTSLRQALRPAEQPGRRFGPGIRRDSHHLLDFRRRAVETFPTA